jgi:hypothetical protein
VSAIYGDRQWQSIIPELGADSPQIRVPKRGTWVFETRGRGTSSDRADSTICRPMPHQAWASADALVFITVDARWDVNWVSGPPTKSDPGERRPRNGPARRAIPVR